MSATTRRDLAVLLLLCVLLFGFRLGRLGLIDPDEPFYAQTAAEMLDRHDWVTPHIFGQPQFEKPILFYWLSAASFAALGRNELAARLPGVLAATALVLMTWAFGRRAFGPRAGTLAGLVLASGAAFAVTARMMLTDVVFSVFVCASCLLLWRAVDPASPLGRGRRLLLAALASALAVLTKGPLGLLIPALAALGWRLVSRRPLPLRPRAWLAAAALWALVATPWYAAMLTLYRGDYARAFFVHENFERLIRAEHPANNRLDYYPAVLLLGSFPWLPALAVTLRRARRRIAASAPALFLAVWFAAALVFFTLAQSKLPTYVVFLFVPLALLTGATLDDLLRDGFAGRSERIPALTLGALQALALLAAPALGAARPFAATLLGAAACLAVAALLARRPSPAWVAASALATLALIVGATTWSADAVETATSTRPAARALAQRRDSWAPVLSSPFLVRGMWYYAHRGARVLSNRGQPFFTPHPLPVVRGPEELRGFARDHGPTLCVMRAKEWGEIERRADPPLAAESQAIGDKLIVRVEPQRPR